MQSITAAWFTSVDKWIYSLTVIFRYTCIHTFPLILTHLRIHSQLHSRHITGAVLRMEYSDFIAKPLKITSDKAQTLDVNLIHRIVRLCKERICKVFSSTLKFSRIRGSKNVQASFYPSSSVLTSVVVWETAVGWRLAPPRSEIWTETIARKNKKQTKQKQKQKKQTNNQTFFFAVMHLLLMQLLLV